MTPSESRCQARSGDGRWRRLAEVRTGSAKSVFHFDVPGSVAKSTPAGLPWLRQADLDGSMEKFLNPSLSPAERAAAKVEGWIPGVL